MAERPPGAGEADGGGDRGAGEHGGEDAGDGELPVEMEKLLAKLLEEGAEPEEIGVVYPPSFDTAVLLDLTRRIRRRLIPLDVTTVRADLGGRIVHGSVADFKGLERPIMICVGFDDPSILELRPWELYTATTRANFGLYVLSDAPFVETMMQRI